MGSLQLGSWLSALAAGPVQQAMSGVSCNAEEMLPSTAVSAVL